MLFTADIAYPAALPILTRDTAPNPARIRRETLPLDGVWNLSVCGGPSEPVVVPFAPQSKVNGITVPRGKADLRYDRTVELPFDWEGGMLHIEGADHEADVLMNGVKLCRHKGAYDPIGIFVPASVLALGVDGDSTKLHSLTVAVRDYSGRRSIISGKQERQTSEGVIFYGNMSGLWKSVWIERAQTSHINDFKIVASGTGDLTATIDVASPQDGQNVLLTLAHEGLTFSVSGAVEGGRAVLKKHIDDVRAWSLQDPNLYFGTLTLLDHDRRLVDSIETYVGFRTFVMDWDSGYYRLNGQPFYFQGLLNQAIYPDTLYTPTDQHTLTDFEHTLEQGFNGERRHQTTPRHRDLWFADKMGYWLSIELPSARDLLKLGSRANAIAEWGRIIRAYAWNHPCVFFLVPINEDWGMLEHRHHEVKATDTDREAFQIELGLVTEEIAPPGMPYAANDGWRVITSRKFGMPVETLARERLMLNIHDYAENSLLKHIYGRIECWPDRDTWGENPRHVFHSHGYGYDGQTPIMMSEIGGRALLNRPSKGVFAYGKTHTDPEVWAAELAELITLMGTFAFVRGGYVLTQTRDAGNDPDDDTSKGEVNGLLDAQGVLKYPGPVVQEANGKARELWIEGFKATSTACASACMCGCPL
ncbi:MAG: hypothetical protein JWS10_3673 [Cypionkella sp.]|uniref:hypothetical protein n=1 Tax=Cypionkella sp. TaxID=2811411 RepID=UPI002617923E|nr:hypothetical protein [Cypionkella sp.]MDB5661058.1 hypothetical protein [Cypionkella sp.]